MTLPELHLADWRPTKDTLHLYCQILGKVRLATTSPRNHWWNAPLYVDVRGLTTRRLHHGETEFEIALDFIDDALVVQTGDGRIESVSLAGGLPVAGFDACLHDALRNLGIDVAIQEQPFGVPMKTSFREDTEHASWDHDAVERFGRILDWSDSVLEEFSGWFNGKTSPVHFFWHGFDLAVTRFSGRPSGNSSDDPVTREAYSHEVISFGFWPGDDKVPDAAYYSYTAPEPEGLRDQPLAVGGWVPTGSLILSRHRPVRRGADVRRIPGGRCSHSVRAPTRPEPASPAGTRPRSPRAHAPRLISCRSSRQRPQDSSAAQSPVSRAAHAGFPLVSDLFGRCQLPWPEGERSATQTEGRSAPGARTVASFDGSTDVVGFSQAEPCHSFFTKATDDRQRSHQDG